MGDLSNLNEVRIVANGFLIAFLALLATLFNDLDLGGKYRKFLIPFILFSSLFCVIDILFSLLNIFNCLGWITALIPSWGASIIMPIYDCPYLLIITGVLSFIILSFLISIILLPERLLHIIVRPEIVNYYKYIDQLEQIEMYESE